MHLARRGRGPEGPLDYVVKFDADGQHKPRLIPNLLLALVTGTDIVVASRYHPLSLANGPPETRVVTNRIMASLVGRIMKENLTDVRSGFMAFQFRHIAAIARHLKIERYGVPFELLLRTWSRDHSIRIREVPSRADYLGTSVAKSRIDRVHALTASEEAKRFAEAMRGFLMVLSDAGIAYDKEGLLAPVMFSLTRALAKLVSLGRNALWEEKREIYLPPFYESDLKLYYQKFLENLEVYVDEPLVEATSAFVELIYDTLFDLKQKGVEPDLTPFVQALGFTSLGTEGADDIPDVGKMLTERFFPEKA
jgi:hypothetical protein